MLPKDNGAAAISSFEFRVRVRSSLEGPQQALYCDAVTKQSISLTLPNNPDISLFQLSAAALCFPSRLSSEDGTAWSIVNLGRAFIVEQAWILIMESRQSKA